MTSKRYSGICSGCGKKSDKLIPHLGVLLCEKCLKEAEALEMELVKTLAKRFDIKERRAMEIYERWKRKVNDLYSKYWKDERREVG